MPYSGGTGWPQPAWGKGCLVDFAVANRTQSWRAPDECYARECCDTVGAIASQVFLWGLCVWFLGSWVHRCCQGRCICDCCNADAQQAKQKPGFKKRAEIVLVGGTFVFLLYTTYIWPEVVNFTQPRRSSLTAALQCLGIAVSLTATLLFVWSHCSLGRSWSPIVEADAQHELVTSGLYRFARHPMYTSFLLYAVAAALCSLNLLTTAGIIVISVWASSRFREEEALMIYGDAIDGSCYTPRGSRVAAQVVTHALAHQQEAPFKRYPGGQRRWRVALRVGDEGPGRCLSKLPRDNRKLRRRVVP